MSKTANYPFVISLAAILLCLIGIFIILYFGQDIIFPILLSLLFAIILRPVVSFLIRRLRFPHFIAVIFAIVLFVLIFLGLFYFISLQVSDMAYDWEKIKILGALQYITIATLYYDQKYSIFFFILGKFLLESENLLIENLVAELNQ
jgi:predicted PurR-regulated permease PerM